MSVDLVFARAQLEGWIVNHTGSKEGEELWAIVNDLVEAERDRVIETNAGLREAWLARSPNVDIETFSLRLAGRLIEKWRGSADK